MCVLRVWYVFEISVVRDELTTENAHKRHIHDVHWGLMCISMLYAVQAEERMGGASECSLSGV